MIKFIHLILIYSSIVFAISCNGSGGSNSTTNNQITTDTIPNNSETMNENSGSDSGTSTAPQVTSQVSLVPEVQTWFMDMNEFLISKLNKTAINNIIVEYTDTDSSLFEFKTIARGRCDNSGNTPKIILYRSDWVGKEANDYFREGIFYHLVGHCIFNRDHFNAVNKWHPSLTPVRSPKSYMHSNWGPNLFKPDPLYHGTQGPTSDDINSLKLEFYYYGDNTY